MRVLYLIKILFLCISVSFLCGQSADRLDHISFYQLENLVHDSIRYYDRSRYDDLSQYYVERARADKTEQSLEYCDALYWRAQYYDKQRDTSHLRTAAAYKELIDHAVKNKLSNWVILRGWQWYAVELYYHQPNDPACIHAALEGLNWAIENDLEKTEVYISFLSSLKTFYSRTGQRLKALEIAKKTFKVIQKYPEFYIKIGAGYKNLAIQHQGNGLLQKADSLFILAKAYLLENGEKGLYAEALASHANNKYKEGKYVEAYRLREELLKCLEVDDLSTSFKTIMRLITAPIPAAVGDSLTTQLALEEAIAAYPQDSKSYTRAINSRMALSSFLDGRGQYTKALELLDEAKTIIKRTFGKESFNYQQSIIIQSRLLLKQGKYKLVIQNLEPIFKQEELNISDNLKFSGLLNMLEAAYKSSQSEIFLKYLEKAQVLKDKISKHRVHDYIKLAILEAKYRMAKNENHLAFIALETSIDKYITGLKIEYDQLVESEKIQFRSNSKLSIHQIRDLLFNLSTSIKASKKLLLDLNLGYSSLTYNASEKQNTSLKEVMGLAPFNKYQVLKKYYSEQVRKNRKDKSLPAIMDSIEFLEQNYVIPYYTSNLLNSERIFPFLTNSALVYFFDSNPKDKVFYAQVINGKQIQNLSLDKRLSKEEIWFKISPFLSSKSILIRNTIDTYKMCFDCVSIDQQKVIDQFSISLFNPSSFKIKNDQEDQIGIIADIQYEINRNDEQNKSLIAQRMRSSLGNLIYSKKEAAYLKELNSSSVLIGQKGANAEQTIQFLSDQEKTIIHIGTHGYFNESDSINYQSLVDNGLVLSSENNAYEYLSAFEINQLNFSTKKLMTVLSCNSAQGVFLGEDGVFGLQKAFMHGGVQNLVVANAEIEDLTAYLFVQQFYKALITKNQSIKSAFTQAKRYIKNNRPGDQWKHFVLYGNGQKKVQFTKKSSPLILFGCVLLLFISYIVIKQKVTS